MNPRLLFVQYLHRGLQPRVVSCTIHTFLALILDLMT